MRNIASSSSGLNEQQLLAKNKSNMDSIADDSDLELLRQQRQQVLQGGGSSNPQRRFKGNAGGDLNISIEH